MKNLFHKKNKISNAGFTMVEMLVVLAIFAILTAVVVFKYGEFNAKIVLTNTAYEVALQVREAQFFGLGARAGKLSETFQGAYGVYINLNDGSAPVAGKTKRTVLFSDSNQTEAGTPKECDGGCACTGAVGDECVQVITTLRDTVISNIYVKNTNYPDCNPIDEVSITFKRPNPDAHIRDTSDNLQQNLVAIQLEAGDGYHEYVVVRNTGQISVVGQAEIGNECSNAS